MNVDFRWLLSCVLNNEEHLGDEFNDVARLQDQVTFPFAAADRRRGGGVVRRLLELQTAFLQVLYTRCRAIKLQCAPSDTEGKWLLWNWSSARVYNIAAAAEWVAIEHQAIKDSWEKPANLPIWCGRRQCRPWRDWAICGPHQRPGRDIWCSTSSGRESSSN